jgi:aspartate-semialdehyde dehydrogenase
MEELTVGTRARLEGQEVTNSVFAHPLPFNLIPHIDKFQDNGYTKEEMKVRASFTTKGVEENACSLIVVCLSPPLAICARR